MSTPAVRGSGLRSARRRKTVLNLDLNCFPPGENQEQGGPSTQHVPQEVQTGQQLPVAQPVMIDVEAIEDDEVVESSARAFTEAKNNLRRNRRRTIVDVDLVKATVTHFDMRLLRPWANNHFKLLLSACQEKPSIVKLHALIILTGNFTQKNNIDGQLIASYARIGDIELARQVFDLRSQRGIKAWNAMIVANSRKGYTDEVLNLYDRMILEGIRPDSSIFTVALKACTRLLDLKMGKEIWSKALDFGYGNDVFVGCSVLNLYAKCGKMDDAMELFDKMPRKDIVCWTTVISGYAQCGRAMEALDVYRKMPKEGMDRDEVVMLGLVQAIANLRDSRLGLSVHGYLIRRNIPMGVVIQTSLVDMYAKTGNLGLAFQVFSMMPHKNIISWAALISGLAQNGFAGNTIELLVEMQSLGYKPDFVCLVSALLACSQIGCLKLGKSVHGYLIKRLDCERVSGTALIDMYSKCGSLSSARALFYQIRFKDAVSWNAMISTCGIHGNGKEALSLFQQMITETNTEPDHATFAALLSALSHSGLVQEGRYWLNLMINKFKIPANEKHYACMIDLLARAGQVKEALKLIDSMKTNPGVAIWVALLAGCCNYEKFFIGEKVAKKVLELNPDDPGIYALISNLFAKACKWDEVAEVKKIMNVSRVKKVPGYSVVEVNGRQHAFVMEDKSHHLYKNIVYVLDNLDLEMRVAGYVTFDEFLLFDLEEDTDEKVNSK